MVRRIGLLALLLGAAGAAPCAPAPPARFRDFPMPAQDFVCNDASGDLWVHGRTGNSPAYRYTGSDWQPVSTPAGNSECVFMAPGPTGGVYALFLDRSASKARVVRYARAGAATVAEIPYTQEPSRLLIEPGGAVWVLGSSRTLLRIAPGGQPVPYPIPDDGIARLTPGNMEIALKPVSGAVDHRGRVWFWSDSSLPYANYNDSIRGFAIWNGKEIIPAGHLFGLADGQINTVTPKDKTHFWVCVRDYGPYCVDTDALTGERAFQTGASLASAQRVFSDGRNWFALVWPNRAPSRRYGELWRLSTSPASSQGNASPSFRWTPVITGIQASGIQSKNTSAAATKTGTWFGASGGGVWWIPGNGAAAVLVDWRRGNPDDQIAAFGRLPDGRIVAAAANAPQVNRTAGVLMPTAPPPLLPPSDPAIETISTPDQTGDPLRPDSRGRLWAIHLAPPGTLDEWDGDKHIAHPLPDAAKPEVWSTLAVDDQDRIWLFRYPDDRQPPKPGVLVFDPQTGQWQTFGGPQAALQSRAADPNFGFRPEWKERPLVKDGKICFFLSRYMYFDGKEWHTWASQDIAKHEYLFETIRFDGEEPEIDGSIHDWKWDGGAWRQDGLHRWVQDPERNDLIGRLPLEKTARERIGSVAADQDGGIWFTAGGQLYHALGGAVTPVFDSGKANPFSAGMEISAVLKDADDRFWIKPAYPDDSAYVRLMPREQTSAIMLDAHRNAPDDFTATAAGAPAGCLFMWRLDGGPPITTGDSSHRWRYVTPGRHVVSVTPMSAQSLPLQGTVTIAILSTATPQDQIPRLIALLSSGSDSDREEAAADLRTYGDAAVPALKAARATAGSSGGWWIDTVLQKIGEAGAPQ